MRVWSGSNWLKTGTGGGSCEHGADPWSVDVAVKRLSLLLRAGVISGSSLGPTTGYSHHIRPWAVPSISFTIH